MKTEWYKTKAYVEEKVWAKDDTYLVVSVQVPESSFKAGQTVIVTVAPMANFASNNDKPTEVKKP